MNPITRWFDLRDRPRLPGSIARQDGKNSVEGAHPHDRGDAKPEPSEGHPSGRIARARHSDRDGRRHLTVISTCARDGTSRSTLPSSPSKSRSIAEPIHTRRPGEPLGRYRPDRPSSRSRVLDAQGRHPCPGFLRARVSMARRREMTLSRWFRQRCLVAQRRPPRLSRASSGRRRSVPFEFRDVPSLDPKS